MKINNAINKIQNNYPTLEQINKKQLKKSILNMWFKLGISTLAITLLMKNNAFASSPKPSDSYVLLGVIFIITQFISIIIFITSIIAILIIKIKNKRKLEKTNKNNIIILLYTIFLVLFILLYNYYLLPNCIYYPQLIPLIILITSIIAIITKLIIKRKIKINKILTILIILSIILYIITGIFREIQLNYFNYYDEITFIDILNKTFEQILLYF